MGNDDYEYDDLYSYEDGFADYVPTTVDPSPWAFVATLAFCLFLVTLLPFFVALWQHIQRKRRKAAGLILTAAESSARRPAIEDPTKATGTVAETASTEKGAAAAPKALTPPSPVLRSKSSPTPSSSAMTCGAFDSFALMADTVTDTDDDWAYGLHEDDSNSDDVSVNSEESAAYEGCGFGIDLTLDHLDRHQRGKAQRLKNLGRLVKRVTHSSEVQQPTMPPPRRKSTGTLHDDSSPDLLPENTQGVVGWQGQRLRTVTTRVIHEASDIETQYVSIERHTGELPEGHKRVVEVKHDLLKRRQSQLDSDGDEDLLCDDTDDETRGLMTEFEQDLFADEYDPDDVRMLIIKEGGRTAAATPYVRTGDDGDITKSAAIPSEYQNHLHDRKYAIHLCMGRRPWFCYYFSSGFRRKLRKCMARDKEMEMIFKYAVPYTFEAVVGDLLGLVEIVVISHVFAGKNAAILGGYFAVELVSNLATMLVDGGLESLTILCSHAVGAQDHVLAGKYVNLAIVVYLVVLFPMAAVGWNYIDRVVLWLGFDEDVAEQALHYGRISFVTSAVGVFNEGIHHMLNVSGLVWFSTLIGIVQYLVVVIILVIVGYTVDNPQLWIVGVVELLCCFVFTVVTIAIIRYKKWLVGFWDGLLSPAILDRQAVRVFFKTAAPLSVGYIIEYGEWELLFIFAAAQGPAEVTTWGLLGWIWEIVENFSHGMSDAAEVRVANLVGRNKPAAACYSSHKCIFLGVTSSCLVCVVVLALQNYIPMLLTPDETIGHMIQELLPKISVGLAALAFGNISYTILCAQGRTRLATAITFCGSVLITLPLAAISTFVWNFNLEGLVAALVIGYASSGAFNSFLVATTNWEKVCHKIASRGEKEKAIQPNKSLLDAAEVELAKTQKASTTDSEETNPDWDDYDWKELPEEIKKAAGVLGYTQRKWDFDVPVSSADKDWEELTAEEQNAATVLSYNEKSWNKDHKDEF